MDPKIIRRIIFKFDNSNSYCYDVNQNIKIVDLKKILESGLQIPRFKIRLYHENIEYTNLDDSRIETLFPKISEITFQVSFHPLFITDKSEKEIAIKLKLGSFCKLHENKYPCHFCFDCNDSFCSICHKLNLHKDHETIEKYDYLQDAESIVERIFSKLTHEVKSLKFDNNEEILLLENKIKGNYFDSLRLMLTRIEDKARSLLKLYSDINLISLKEIEENLKKVKQSCTEALLNKKEELQMQNIIIDDSIVVSYYNTILQIYNQKEPIFNDIKKFVESHNSCAHVNTFVDNITKELNLVLESILSSNEQYKKCEKEITKFQVNPISTEEVKTVLYRDISNSSSKKPQLHPRIYEENPFNGNFKGPIGKCLNMDEDINAGKKINKNTTNSFNLEENVENINGRNLQNTLTKMKGDNLDKGNIVNVVGFETGNNVSHASSTMDLEDKVIKKESMHEKNVNMFLQNISDKDVSKEGKSSEILSSLKNNEKKLIYSQQNYKVLYSVVNFHDIENKNINLSNNDVHDILIYSLIPNSRYIYAYNEYNQKMKKIEIKIPFSSNFDNFLENSSFLNVKDKLYISGGTCTTPGLPSQFFYYDNKTTSLKILPDLKEYREKHSMIYHNNSIYILGGENANTLEIYNLNDLTLISKENLNYESVDYPLLWIQKDYLYSFFGKKNGKFVDYVQRVNLNSPKLKWEKVAYKINNKELNLKTIKCGIIPFGANEVFFFGGIKEDQVTKDVFSYDFEMKEFSNTKLKLNEPNYFNNSQFCKLPNNEFGLFSSSEKENFIKICLDLQY